MTTQTTTNVTTGYEMELQYHSGQSNSPLFPDKFMTATDACNDLIAHIDSKKDTEFFDLGNCGFASEWVTKKENKGKKPKKGK